MTTEIKVKRLVNFETAIDGTAVKFIVRDVANRTEADGTTQLCLLREIRLGVQAVLGQGRGHNSAVLFFSDQSPDDG